MVNRMYDLVMWLNEELAQLDSQMPAHRNAMRQGTLAGLELGKAWTEAGWWGADRNAEVLKVLTQDKKVSLMDVLSQANKYMPKGYLFSPGMFVHYDYRRSDSGKFYLRGVEMGFTYVMDLREAFAKTGTAVSGYRNSTEYLKLVRTGVSTIS